MQIEPILVGFLIVAPFLALAVVGTRDREIHRAERDLAVRKAGWVADSRGHPGHRRDLAVAIPVLSETAAPSILQRMPKAKETPAAVTYTGLPISSGGAHSLGRMSRRVAFERTTAFIEACTQPVGPIEYRFDVPDVPGLRPDIRPRLGWKMRRRFGHDGRVPEERVPAALDFLDEIDPQPTNQWGMAPIWFWTVCRFLILDPSTGRPLPAQDPERFHGVEYEWRVPLGTSAVHLTLHDHATLGIELCIPDADDEVLRRVVPWLQDYLPFKFSPKQWREWTPTQSGSFKVRKMSAPGGI